MITGEGAFFCHACLEDKASGDASPDDRYCRGCYDFLLKEAEILAERGVTRRPHWWPKTPEPPPGHSSETPEGPPARQNTCNKIQTRGRHGAGRPPADIPAREVIAMASQGMALRDIAGRLGVSHMTIKRVLAKANTG